MADKQKNRFFLKSIAACILIAAPLFFLSDSFSPQSFWVVLSVPLAALLVNIIGFSSATGNFSQKNINNLVTLLFGIKFFSYLVFSLIFFIVEKGKTARLLFVAIIFVVYVINTVLLLTNVLSYLKKRNT